MLKRADDNFLCNYIEHGADSSIKNNDGDTAYDLALKSGNDSLASLFRPSMQ